MNSAAADVDVIDEIGIGSSEVRELRNPSAIVRALVPVCTSYGDTDNDSKIVVFHAKAIL